MSLNTKHFVGLLALTVFFSTAIIGQLFDVSNSRGNFARSMTFYTVDKDDKKLKYKVTLFVAEWDPAKPNLSSHFKGLKVSGLKEGVYRYRIEPDESGFVKRSGSGTPCLSSYEGKVGLFQKDNWLTVFVGSACVVADGPDSRIVGRIYHLSPAAKDVRIEAIGVNRSGRVTVSVNNDGGFEFSSIPGGKHVVFVCIGNQVVYTGVRTVYYLPQANKPWVISIPAGPILAPGATIP